MVHTSGEFVNRVLSKSLNGPSRAAWFGANITAGTLGGVVGDGLDQAYLLATGRQDGWNVGRSIFAGVQGAVASAASAAAAWRSRACFSRGTPLRTPDGSKPIEDFRVGDWILSRDEFDPAGPVLSQRVEEVFVRTGRVWVLTLNGRAIHTTGEHPFFAEGHGWKPLAELAVGDRLLGESGDWLTIEALEDTGRYETVYNIRVSEFSTYFVGGEDWGFSVWAHNACEVVQERDALTTAKDGRRKVGSWLDIKDDDTGYRARWFKPEGVDQAEVLRLAQIDSTEGLGGSVQRRVQGYADEWHNLPNSEKWTEGQLRRINIEVERMNVIRDQLGLERVNPQNFLNGENPAGLPRSAPADLQAQYYKSRTQAFQQRAAGQGDYVDTQMLGHLTRPGRLEVIGQGQPDLLFLPSQVRVEVFRGNQWNLHAQRLSEYAWRGMSFTPHPQ